MKKKGEKCIACIMAHADDIELSGGGTFAKYIAHGYKGIYGVLSFCNSGWSYNECGKGIYKPSTETIPIRLQEAEEAALIFQAEIFRMKLLEDNFTDSKGNRNHLSFATGNYNDNEIPKGGIPLVNAASSNTPAGIATIKRLTDFLVKNTPDLVIGQCIDSNNPDHFNAALILRKAYLEASKRVKLGPYYIGHASQPFFPIEPDWIVDITGFEEVAEKAISCHESQNGACRVKRMRLRWKKWGEVINVTSGEPFIRIL
jgi:LmbE family N-acetylglucosaminyl deacetylase